MCAVRSWRHWWGSWDQRKCCSPRWFDFRINAAFLLMMLIRLRHCRGLCLCRRRACWSLSSKLLVSGLVYETLKVSGMMWRCRSWRRCTRLMTMKTWMMMQSWARASRNPLDRWWTARMPLQHWDLWSGTSARYSFAKEVFVDLLIGQWQVPSST